MRTGLIGALALLATVAARAEPPRAIVRGVIADISPDAKTLTMKARTGESVLVRLKPETRLIEVVPATRADLKPDAFIGVAAVPDSGDTLRALEVHIFPEAMRGTGEGYRPFDLAPNSSMTNGALNARLSGVDGDILTVTYKGGARTIRLPANAPIVSFAPGDKADLKVGAAAIARGTKADDGAVDAAALLVGKDGLVPPM
jgi:hypothetical protein